MKALVYTKPNEVIYREEPKPIPGLGESLVRVEASGICGSDMHAYHGKDERRTPPLILGHEVAGRVVAGPGSGTRVVINPLITCNQCIYCETGRHNLCNRRELIGMRLAGAFAEYVSIPSQNVVRIPDFLNPIHASLTEPLATVIHALNLIRVKSFRPLSELRTLIIGGGSIGFLGALLLRSHGSRELIVSEANSLRRESIVKHINCKVNNPINDMPLPPNDFDLVIDTVGADITRKSSIVAVKPGGICVHIGLMNSKGEIDIRKITLFEISLIGVYCYTPADIRAAAKIIETPRLLGDFSWIETRSLSEGTKAFHDLNKGRIASAKIVLVP